MEYFDIRTPDGKVTGKIKERSLVHRDGDLPRHVPYLAGAKKYRECLGGAAAETQRLQGFPSGRV